MNEATLEGISSAAHCTKIIQSHPKCSFARSFKRIISSQQQNRTLLTTSIHRHSVSNQGKLLLQSYFFSFFNRNPLIVYLQVLLAALSRSLSLFKSSLHNNNNNNNNKNSIGILDINYYLFHLLFFFVLLFRDCFVASLLACLVLYLD